MQSTAPSFCPMNVYLRPRRYGSCSVSVAQSQAAAHASSAAAPSPPSVSPSTTGRAGADVATGAIQDSTLSLSIVPSPNVVPPTVYAPVCSEVPAAEENATMDMDTNVAKSAQEATTPKTQSLAQSLKEILTLSIPALGSTLADPVCSLVDTACVGQASSLQLAALSPCTAIFNLAFLVFQFVGVTITAKLASNNPKAPGLSADEAADRLLENQRLVSYSITFALIAGLCTCGVLLTHGPQILSAMGTNSAMMSPALSYLSWRALAAPAVMLMNVCQGVCLGQQNSITPLAVFASVGISNVFLDLWLIIGQGMGCTGAAMSTAAAQWVGALFFLWYLKRKGDKGKSVPIKWMGLPTVKDLKPFIGMASVLLSRTVFSMAAFTIITGAATARGTMAAATHQVCLQVFWFLSYFPEPLSVTAQSLIARDRSSRPRTIQLTRCILGLATGLGLSIAVACATCFYFGSGFFTSDPAIALGMQSIGASAFGALIICSLAMAVDGISIGTDDYAHLPMVNFCGLAATAACLHWCNINNLGLQQVWYSMVVVFAVRLLVHTVHHLGTGAATSAVAEALGWRQSRNAVVHRPALLPAPAVAALA